MNSGGQTFPGADRRETMAHIKSCGCAICASTVFIAVAWFGASVQGGEVKLGTSTLFYDEFEDEAVYAEPLPNGAGVGQWSGVSGLTHIQNGTSDSGDPYGASSGAPTAALSGAKFLRLYRDGAYSTTGSFLGANFGSIPTPGSGSTTISARFALWVPSGAADYTAQFALSSDAFYTGAPAYIYARSDGTLTYYNNNTSSHVTIVDGSSVPLTYQKNAWQVFQLDYTLLPGGSNDIYTITVGGRTSSANPAMYNASGAADTSATSLQYLVFSTGNVGSFFVDIPEPAAASMGAIAFGGLVSIRRRNHKSEHRRA